LTYAARAARGVIGRPHDHRHAPICRIFARVDQTSVPRVQALLLTGTVGAGKTSVAETIGDLLSHAGIANAVIDVDWLRRSWPRPPEDPFNIGIALRNLRRVAENYLQAGAARLVLAGVIESRTEQMAYQAAVQVPLTVCRLRVDLPTIHRRLIRRHENDDIGLRWHLHRSGELDQILEQAQVEDVVVDATRTSIQQTAEAVVAAVGW
jgi:adenylylsulfate kinase-like enzyme